MAGVDLAANLPVVLQQVLDALGAPVTSCIGPGRNAPSHSNRPAPSLIAVGLMA
jgi:hypothetical protein